MKMHKSYSTSQISFLYFTATVNTNIDFNIIITAQIRSQILNNIND